MEVNSIVSPDRIRESRNFGRRVLGSGPSQLLMKGPVMKTLSGKNRLWKACGLLARACLCLFVVATTGLFSPASAQVLFDFDSGPIHTSLPLTLSVGGVTAHFSATGQGYSIQDYFGNLFVPIGFSGLFLSPNSIYASDLIIHFDQTLTDFAIAYAPEEYGCDSSATMRVTVYRSGSYVGTNTMIARNPGTWPVDTLSCSFPQGFDSVVVHYDHHPISGCTDWGPIFAADNMVVTPSLTQPPIVTTDSAKGVTATIASLYGTVDANGNDATAMFEWGTTTAYGNLTTPEIVTVAGSPRTIVGDLSKLTPATTYHYRITATSSGGTSTGLDEMFTTASGGDTLHSYTVQGRWNIVSVPVTVVDYTAALLYPTAHSKAFGYQNGYTEQPVLACGAGYWLKFDSTQIVTLSGSLLMLDSIPVQTGWNLIGSLSVPVATASITPDPGGIIASRFWGYSTSYYVADTIQPGQGYWVRVNQPGTLILNPGGAIPGKNHFAAPSSDELPPPPPDELASTLRPEIPGQFGLDQNYPNPFNPSTRFSYALAASAHVTLRVFNVLGQDVATLIDGQEGAGYKSVLFDASHLPGGVYFYRLDAMNLTNPDESFMRVRKMLLLK